MFKFKSKKKNSETDIKEPKKEPKKTTNKKKSKNSIGIKIFVWFMFIAMAASFLLPLIAYLLSAK